jgi:hypothetical protein
MESTKCCQWQRPYHDFANILKLQRWPDVKVCVSAL